MIRDGIYFHYGQPKKMVQRRASGTRYWVLVMINGEGLKEPFFVIKSLNLICVLGQDKKTIPGFI